MDLVIKMTTDLENSEIYDCDYEIIIEESSDEEEENIDTTDLTIFNNEKGNYYIGSEICKLLGYKNTTSSIKKNVSDNNKIKFKNFSGKKEPVLDPRQILINKEGVYELLEKNKKISQCTIDILIKADIDVYKIIKRETETHDDDDKKHEKDELTTYSYINNGYCFEYFVGFEITSLLGYKNAVQTLINVSKCNQLVFKDYPGVKKPKLDPKSILITRDGAIELLIKTRKRLTPDVLHMLKEFGIETTNRKCLTKEQQTLSAIANAFKTEKIEDQFKIGSYYLDMYFPDYKIVVECDENGHADRKPYKERERMDYVNKEFDIDDTNWMRYNPDEYDFDLSKVIGKIYRKIDEIKYKKYSTKNESKKGDSDSEFEIIYEGKEESKDSEAKSKPEIKKSKKEESEEEDEDVYVYEYNTDTDDEWPALEIQETTGKFLPPPKDFFIKKLKKYSIEKIGLRYGISAKPVTRWLKDYDINLQNFRKKMIPTKEELKKMLSERTGSETAEFYEVSKHVLRKWCKDYGFTVEDERNKSKTIKKEELIKLVGKKSIDEIAKDSGLSSQSVTKLIKIHNIRNIPPKYELEKMIKTMTKEDIAKYYKTTRTTLRKWLKSYDLYNIRAETACRQVKVLSNITNEETIYSSVSEACKKLHISHSKLYEIEKSGVYYYGNKFEIIEKKF